MSHHYAVILAGGRGERFWPQSRVARPKHLLPIVGERPMVAQTVLRLEELVPADHVFILTNTEHVAAVRAACPEVPAEQIIGEPVGRDTAPAAALAALLVKRADPGGIMALLPADAAIHDGAGYRAVLGAAFAAAEKTASIFTIGVPPTFPAIAYGYLRRGEKLGESAGHPWYRVERFVEKPIQPLADQYFKEGGYLWNAGMFVVRAAVLETAFRQHAPAIAAGMQDLQARLDGGSPLAAALAAVYPGLTKISVDYAVMEKAANVAVLAATFDWDDVGEWPAIVRHSQPDAAGNVTRGEVVLHDAHGNLAIGEPGHLIAILGMDDLVVVHTPDATLICPKARAQELKALLKDVAARPGGQRWL